MKTENTERVYKLAEQLLLLAINIILAPDGAQPINKAALVDRALRYSPLWSPILPYLLTRVKEDPQQSCVSTM